MRKQSVKFSTATRFVPGLRPLKVAVCYSGPMTYIALLRGVNVGGKNKVSMAALKEVFESLGCSLVKTYINSGNVVFNDSRSAATLSSLIEESLADAFGFEIKSLIVDQKRLGRICAALPAQWRNDEAMKCDVMFLWDEKNSEKVLEEITIKPGIDSVKYIDGALLWSVDRKHLKQSGMLRMVGTDLYRHMTIRNCNTVRKLRELAANN